VEWAVENGARVRAGDVIAKLSQEESKSDVVIAEAGLKKIELLRDDRSASLDDGLGTLRVAIEKVEGQLRVAERYASATPYAVAKNDILDAIQDRGYLRKRKSVIQWQINQHSTREHAEMALLDDQKYSLSRSLDVAKRSLGAGVIVADRDGVVVLLPDWNGQLPHAGSIIFSGNPFAFQATSSRLVATFEAARSEMSSVSLGAPIDVSMVGQSDAWANLRVSSKSEAAQQLDASDPIAHYLFRVDVPPETANEKHWLVGGEVVGRITLPVTGAKP
jgi:multidrug efflux pump subunit AcrA (membrane-fusion protein)